MILQEYNIADIIKNVDTTHYHHKEHYNYLIKNSKYYLLGIKEFVFWFKMKSSGEYKQTEKNYYLDYLYFPQLKMVYNNINFVNIKKSQLKKIYLQIASVLKHGDVKLYCSCPAFKFLGYDYILTIINSKQGNPENRFPKITNPDLDGIVCKHLHYILQDFKDKNILAIYTDIMFDYMYQLKFREIFKRPPKLHKKNERFWRQYIEYKINFKKMQHNLEVNKIKNLYIQG